eukprot:1142672-Pelagomonas_calceolata.AAC.9
MVLGTLCTMRCWKSLPQPFTTLRGACSLPSHRHSPILPTPQGLYPLRIKWAGAERRRGVSAAALGDFSRDAPAWPASFQRLSTGSSRPLVCEFCWPSMLYLGGCSRAEKAEGGRKGGDGDWAGQQETHAAVHRQPGSTGTGLQAHHHRSLKAHRHVPPHRVRSHAAHFAYCRTKEKAADFMTSWALFWPGLVTGLSASAQLPLQRADTAL